MCVCFTVKETFSEKYKGFIWLNVFIRDPEMMIYYEIEVSRQIMHLFDISTHSCQIHID